MRDDNGQCICFQPAADQAAVLKLGATKHEHETGTSFRVFLDPAGHPFCLCLD